MTPLDDTTIIPSPEPQTDREWRIHFAGRIGNALGAMQTVLWELESEERMHGLSVQLHHALGVAREFVKREEALQMGALEAAAES